MTRVTPRVASGAFIIPAERGYPVQVGRPRVKGTIGSWRYGSRSLWTDFTISTHLHVWPPFWHPWECNRWVKRNSAGGPWSMKSCALFCQEARATRLKRRGGACVIIIWRLVAVTGQFCGGKWCVKNGFRDGLIGRCLEPWSVCHFSFRYSCHNFHPKTMITSSPSASSSFAGMLSTPADFPFFDDCTTASISLRRMGWSSSVSIQEQFSTDSLLAMWLYNSEQ